MSIKVCRKLDNLPIEKGILAVVTGAVGAVGWWIKRRITLVDDMHEQLTQLDKKMDSKVDKEYLDKQMIRMYDKIDETNSNILGFYKGRPPPQEN
jgi:hypothetical protein